MKRYITTPLYYVNARPHMGHSYTTWLADMLKRQSRQRGDEVTLLTGTDEHGEKIVQSAAKLGQTPRELCDEVSAAYEETWKKLGIDFDIFYRTTAPAHIQAVQHGLQVLKDKGEIEFREYEGRYCIGCERFYTETELGESGLCPQHKSKPEVRKEGNYFFLMSKYRDRLIEFFEKNPESIQPDHYRKEMLSFLKGQELEDLCVTRPKTRLTWAVEVPFDKNYVTYVWVDALLNYLAATGWPSNFNEGLWNQAVHLIGKDILKTHAIYWGALLMALGVKPFKSLQVNGYILMGGDKMSKSLGNVVAPIETEAKYGEETLRFYLLREVNYGYDASFTLEGYVNCINAYLANGIGNLVSRVLTLCAKNFTGVTAAMELTAADLALLAKRQETLEIWNREFADLKYQNAIKAWSELVTATDLYINEQKPWALAKDPALSGRLQVVLGTCMVVIRMLGALIYPVLPKAAHKICQSVGMQSVSLEEALATDIKKLGKITEVPKLFMRVAIEDPTKDAIAETKK